MASKVLSAILTMKDQNFSSTLKSAAGGVNDFDRRLKHTGNQINQFRENTVTSFRNMAVGVAAGIAGAFAVDKLKNFGISMVESAANAQAMGAQFTQVFGGVQGQAQETVDSLGKSFGMVSERIKPAFTTMTSMFKGLGMDTTEAMKQAQSAVTIAADSAAFYDKSYEDANSALNSFIKGNYEGGEAIGLFANETQMASWATKNLNLDWKKLDEAGKQVARLQFAKSMQEAAGATGQASRESDSYQNQLGNLRSEWDTLKGKLGQPLLEPVTRGLKGVAAWIDKVDTQAIINGFTTFGTKTKQYALPVLDGLKKGIGWIVDNKEPIIAATAGIVGGLVAFKVITGINSALGTFNLLLTAHRAGTLASTAATLGFNTALLANPLTWVAVGIAAVIAGGILLYKNWDTVREKGLALWAGLKLVWVGIEVGFSSMWGKMQRAAANGVNGIIDRVNSLIEKVNKVPGVNIPLLPNVKWGSVPVSRDYSKKSIPQFALGTSYFPGGNAIINERGGEIVDLPNGSRVYPHDKSVQMAKNEGNKVVVNLNIQGNVLSNKQYFDETISYLVRNLELQLSNM
ncbi:hypothetical protein [Cytobacillus luteolus]|uniref:hypothetical protein n=1 Tax=Litchfieldia luteola TaxID=682179 RepID=UPI001AE2ECFF|nr:hypothetical protein [Cytobacillus luteolus]MBP1944630.1 flagellar hook-basal body complex protein FliE [Cytobacillus luteolus]